jgi:hypothetical protein
MFAFCITIGVSIGICICISMVGFVRAFSVRTGRVERSV